MSPAVRSALTTTMILNAKKASELNNTSGEIQYNKEEVIEATENLWNFNLTLIIFFIPLILILCFNNIITKGIMKGE